jgi:RNAse (barnase) inhibitor barstar
MAVKPTLQAHLSNATPPWSSLLIVPRGTSATALVRPPSGFVLRTIQGKQCRTSTGLFDEFARALTFPDYFGHNWDALEECLADFEWLPAKGYILLITDAQAVLPEDEEEYETLLEILDDAGEAWSKGQTTDSRRAPFHALFAIAEQDKSKRKRWELEEFSSTELKPARTKPASKQSRNASKKK